MIIEVPRKMNFSRSHFEYNVIELDIIIQCLLFLSIGTIGLSILFPKHSKCF